MAIEMFSLEGMGDLLRYGRVGIGAIKDAADTTRAVRDAIAKSENGIPGPDVRAAMSNVLQKLIDAQIAQSDIMARVHELEGAFRKAEQIEREFARYELHETNVGTFVYALKESDGNGEPHHYLCPRCREDNKKSILQRWSDYEKKCRACGNRFGFETEPTYDGPIGIY